jgi:hypothetical protein
MAVSILAVLVGFALQPGLVYVEKKRWLRFSVREDLPTLPDSSPVATEEETTSLVV